MQLDFDKTLSDYFIIPGFTLHLYPHCTVCGTLLNFKETCFTLKWRAATEITSCWLTFQCSISIEKIALQLNLELGGGWWVVALVILLSTKVQILGFKTWDFAFGL